jgi:hypothetical protein
MLMVVFMVMAMIMIVIVISFVVPAMIMIVVVAVAVVMGTLEQVSHRGSRGSNCKIKIKRAESSSDRKRMLPHAVHHGLLVDGQPPDYTTVQQPREVQAMSGAFQKFAGCRNKSESLNPTRTVPLGARPGSSPRYQLDSVLKCQ